MSILNSISALRNINPSLISTLASHKEYILSVLSYFLFIRYFILHFLCLAPIILLNLFDLYPTTITTSLMPHADRLSRACSTMVLLPTLTRHFGLFFV